MPIRKVILEDSLVKVLPCDEDIVKLQISDYKRFYLALDPKDDGLYKLHKIIINIDFSGIRSVYKKGYVWIAIWNSVVYTLMDNKEPFSTIDEAIKVAINKGYIVRQLNQTDFFKYLIEDMKFEGK